MFAVTAARIDADDPLAGLAATVLVQGAGGGMATALIVLSRAPGYRVWVTSRGGAKRHRA